MSPYQQHQSTEGKLYSCKHCRNCFLQCCDTVGWATRRASGPVKNNWVLICWWWRFIYLYIDWSLAHLTAPVVTTTSIILSSSKIQNGDVLVPANPDPSGKWPLNGTERETLPIFLCCWILVVLTRWANAVVSFVSMENGAHGSTTNDSTVCCRSDDLSPLPTTRQRLHRGPYLAPRSAALILTRNGFTERNGDRTMDLANVVPAEMA